MGKATKWLKSLLGKSSNSNTNAIVPDISRPDLNNPAVAVAVATAAAADAAVAASRAAASASELAAAVVRLTSQGREGSICLSEVYAKMKAVIKIQSLVRGYLARKAVRDMKALVKLQAFIRGDILRKKLVSCLRRTPRFMINSPGGVNPRRFLTVTTTTAANFTAPTQSFTAKSRSCSAPRQRPEALRKRVQGLIDQDNEGVESNRRRSSNGVRLQRSCTQIHQAMEFRNIAITTPYYYPSNKQRRSKHPI